MELLEFLMLFLSTTQKMDEASIKSLIGADGKLLPTAAQTLLAADAARIAQLETEASTKLEAEKTKVVGQAKGQAIAEYERNLKSKLGISTAKQGDALIEEAISKLSKADVTEAIVQAHPAFIKMQDTLSQQLASKDTEKETALNNLRATISEQETEQSVINTTLAKLKAKQPVIPANPTIAATIEKGFIESFKSGVKFRIDGTGAESKIILLKPNGERLMNVHGHPIEFEDHLNTVAGLYYEFKKAGDRDAPPADPGDGAGAGGSGGTPTYDVAKELTALGLKMPANRAEWSEVFAKVETNNKQTPIDRRKLMAALGPLLNTLKS